MIVIHNADTEYENMNANGCYADCSCDTDTVLPEDCNQG